MIVSHSLLAAAVSGILMGTAGTAESKAPPAEPGFHGARSAAGPRPLADGAKHSCKGQNACKGQGGCKTDKHACKGQNACKGQGGCKG